MLPNTITFDESTVNEILFMFDKATDPEGFVIDENGKRVIAMDGKEIKADDIGGIIGIDGKPTIFRKDIPSLIEVLDVIKSGNT